MSRCGLLKGAFGNTVKVVGSAGILPAGLLTHYILSSNTAHRATIIIAMRARCPRSQKPLILPQTLICQHSQTQCRCQTSPCLPCSLTIVLSSIFCACRCTENLFCLPACSLFVRWC